MNPEPLKLLIGELSNSDLFRLRNPRVFKRNEVVRSAGSKESDLYYIESGCIIVTETIGDEELVIRFAYPGDVLVAIDSFVTKKKSNLVFKALRATSVRRIKSGDFLSFIHESSERLEAWMNLQGSMIVDLMEREKDLMISIPRVRYQRVLERSPRLFQEVPLKYIASYLRMTAETLSRLRS